MIIALVNEAFNKNIRKTKEQFLWCTASTPRPSLLGQLYLSVSRHPWLMLPWSCCVESSSLLTSASLSQGQCRQQPGLRGEPLFLKLFHLSCSVFMCNSLSSRRKERQLSSFSEYSCHPLLSVTCALLPECGRTSLSLRGERDCPWQSRFIFLCFNCTVLQLLGLVRGSLLHLGHFQGLQELTPPVHDLAGQLGQMRGVFDTVVEIRN